MEDDFRILEQNQRFSNSKLWELQHSAYNLFGPIAWSEKGVPFYLTSNPYTARQYAHVVLGYLRDCLSSHSTIPIDLSEPLYIFDLGAGTGRFGYLFLKNLFDLIKGLPFEKVKIRYVMTDIVPSNIDFWQQHPKLQQYLDDGVLDFAYYHHANPGIPLHLMRSNKTLDKTTIVNPIILIGNYFFDTIPQDLFSIKNGKLHEGRVTLKTRTSDQADESVQSIIKSMECYYDYVPIENVDKYYPDFPQLNAILKEYMQGFDNIPFLFPVGAFQSIRYFLEMSKNRLLLLAGDQGVVTKDQINEWGEPHIAKHGTFSISVSYHAIASFFRNRGGSGLLTTDSSPVYVVMAAIAGGTINHFPEVNLAFHQYIDSFEPKDYWNLTGAFLEKEHSGLWTLDTILTMIKLGNWDPMNFYAFFEDMRKQIPKASPSLKKRLLNTIHLVWENLYPISIDEANFVMNLGVLCYDMHFYSEALVYFERALKLGGDETLLQKNIKACQKAMQFK